MLRPQPCAGEEIMFILFLLALVGAGYLHGRLGGGRPIQSRYELLLVYVLAGYCGVSMVGVSIWGMIDPAAASGMLGTEPGSPFQDFFMVAYLGMSVMATLTIWIRGSYLIANVVCWSIYWLGATYLHWVEYQEAGRLTFEMAARILGGHTIVPLLLLILMALSLCAERAEAGKQ